METLNGLGTTLYGREYLSNSKNYIATEWFVILWIPIFPIRSYKVFYESEILYKDNNTYSKSYKLQKTNLNLKQIAFIYFFECMIVSIFLITAKEVIAFTALLFFTIGLGCFYLWLKHGSFSNFIESIKYPKIPK